MLAQLQNYLVAGELETALADVFRPPPRLSPSQWADQYRQLSREANAKGGQWRSFPFQVEPMDSVIDPTVQSTALQWASQITGKTEVVLNIIAYFIHQDPAPILVVQPNMTPMGEAFSKLRIGPMVRDTPALRGLIKEPRARDSGNTVMQKAFPGGHLTITGANAPAGLASRPIRVAIFEEIDRYEPSAGNEGDPVSLGEKRTESFWNAVVFKNSSPTFKGRSRIEREIELSDKRMWYVRCPKCGFWQVLKWFQVKWPEGKPEKAALECQKCSRLHNDKARVKMVRRGQWRATAPFKGKRGYILNGLNTLLRAKRGYKSRLHQMAEDFLDAKARGPQSIQVWTNTFLAETWEDEAQEGPKPEVMYSKREDYELVPENCVVLVAFGDVQLDRVEVGIIGAGAGEELWGIDYRIFKGNVEQWYLWDEIDAYIQQKFRHSSGAELSPVVAGFDTGHKSKIVLQYVKRCQPRRIFATKGVGTSGVPWVQRSRKQPIFLLRVNTAKEAIYSRANLEEFGPGYMHFNKRFDLEFFRQLFSERVVTRFKFGNPYRTFEEHGHNEALDIMVGCMAMLEILRPNYVKLAENLKLSIQTKETEAPKPPPPVRRRPRVMSGLVQNWKR
jgi:phage terminase large subunit GpA-like protein